MEVFKFFDAYAIRARLFPAIIGAAPALAALTLLISWKTFGLSNMIASLGMLVLLWAIADFARARGRAIESALYADYGGMPSITMFRRSDSTIDSGSKDRYRVFLAGKLGVVAPSAADEAADQAAADSFYDQCGNWLRQNTRDTKKFPILFAENVTYGFRRNLLGVKALALALNVFVVAICVLLLWAMSWNFGAPMGNKTAVVLIVAAAHATYMLLAVSRTAVRDASKAYGRELVLSCESFLASGNTPAKKPAGKKVATKTSTAATPPGAP
ncbi:hypothetical protein [Pandoraea sp. ISTKB]|uniref:hypothetical protein n=1 Tax=Pandoraea sp. ISTKB TaxID=1586708 RepID=UPI0008475C95|nr:hypothetical protein [Pandoraea sp. ISTKB]ODP35238.1 hypothetical protein A9762_11150 [Pandoraea sp. ISTKB]